MRAKVFGSIETLSREISVPMRLVPLGEGDFSTLWRLCIESPSQPKLASSLPNKRLSYWRLTGFGRNDNKAEGVFVSICSLQTYDKASASKLSKYSEINQSFFHSPLHYGLSSPPVILSRRRRILVRAAAGEIGSKYRSAEGTYWHSNHKFPVSLKIFPATF